MSQTTAPAAPATLANVAACASHIRDLEDQLSLAREKRTRLIVDANRQGATQAALAVAADLSQSLINRFLRDHGLTTPRSN